MKLRMTNMQNDPRSRILLLLQLLLEQTDEHHYVSGTDILRFLASHGIQATRKNVYSDIRLLMDFGLDIICIKSTQNRYFIGSRLLELPELKELISLLRYSSNNLNQLSRRVHETGRIYDADMEDILQRQDALWSGVNKILKRLGELS